MIGSPDVMSAWPASTGEAWHTSTFLGNPVACAAAVAQLNVIEKEGLLDRAVHVGARVRRTTERWAAELPIVAGVRGRGALQAVLLERPVAAAVAEAALTEGVLVLPEGERGDVLAITPPAVITDEQIDAALAILETVLRGSAHSA
jgi:4-aminobutyrate aminotransferase-like enzyme